MKKSILIVATLVVAVSCAHVQIIATDFCLAQVREWFPQLAPDEHESICAYVIGFGASSVDDYCSLGCHMLTSDPEHQKRCEFLCRGQHPLASADEKADHQAGDWFALVGED